MKHSTRLPGPPPDPCPVLFNAPWIPAGMTGFLRNPQESSGMGQDSSGIEQDSSGMGEDSSGMTGFLRNGTGILRNGTGMDILVLCGGLL